MSNTCGKTYGLTAITRSHPLKTWGLRLVFLLIHISLKKPFVRGAVGGLMLGIGVAVVLGILQLFGLQVSLAMRIGTALGASGAAAWALGLGSYLAASAVLGAAIGSVYQPKWTILGRVTLVQENLAELSFIHFARWVIIPRGAFPRLSPDQPMERLRYDYMFFESNFNGDWAKYIDAFSQIVPGGMDNIWRWSSKYPGSRPITPFLAYIRNASYDTDYYYSAYPGAATNDVMGALKLADALKEFQATSANLPPVEYERAYNTLLVKVQNCLGRTGPPPLPMAVKPPAGVRIGVARQEAAHV